MNQHIKHFKIGKISYFTYPGVDTFQVPHHEQKRINSATKEELFEACEKSGYIDPFVFGEILYRGLYYEYEKQAHPTAPQPSIFDIMLGVENE